LYKKVKRSLVYGFVGLFLYYRVRSFFCVASCEVLMDETTQIKSVITRIENIARYGRADEQLDKLNIKELDILENLVHDISLEFKARRYEEAS